jgi:hypothetical protein
MSITSGPAVGERIGSSYVFPSMVKVAVLVSAMVVPSPTGVPGAGSRRPV